MSEHNDKLNMTTLDFWYQQVHPAAAHMCADMLENLLRSSPELDFVLHFNACRVIGKKSFVVTDELVLAPNDWNSEHNRCHKVMMTFAESVCRPGKIVAWLVAQRLRNSDGVLGASISIGGSNVLPAPSRPRQLALATWCLLGPTASDWGNVLQGRPHILVRHFGGGVGEKVIVREGTTAMAEAFNAACQRDMLRWESQQELR